MPKLKRKTKARADGEGTIYKRDVTRKDGSTFERWEGKVIVGRNPDGSSKRKTLYGKSQNEVLEKIEQLKKQLLTGTYSATSLTVEGFIQQWLEDKAREVEP